MREMELEKQLLEKKETADRKSGATQEQTRMETPIKPPQLLLKMMTTAENVKQVQLAISDSDSGGSFFETAKKQQDDIP